MCRAVRCGVAGAGKELEAVFTPAAIQVDGKVDDAWNRTAKQDIVICMNAQRTAQLNDCKVSGTVQVGTVQAMWNGPVLYHARGGSPWTHRRRCRAGDVVC
ncbi:MAG: hypothetical protein ABI759_16065 [Candidatus Solibacter sp.]